MGSMGARGRVIRRVFWGVLLLASSVAHAVGDVPPPQTQAIEAARSALTGAGLSEAQRKAAQVQLDAAQALEKEAEPLAEKLAALREQAQGRLPDMPEPLTFAEQQNQFAQWAGRLPANIGANALEHLLAEERSASATLKAHIDATTGELTDLISRPSQMLAKIDALRRRADASAGEPQPQADEPDALLAARRVQRQAERRRAQLELAVYEAEQDTAELRQRQLEVQLQTLQQEQALRAQRIEWLSQRIVQASQQRLQEQARKQEELAQLVTASGSADVAELARHNASLAQQLLDYTDRLAQERRTLADYERQREQIAAALRDTQARLRLGGSGTAIGPWLWQQRQRIPSLLELKIKRADAQKQLTALRLRLYSSAEERYALTRSRLQAANAGANAGANADGAASAASAATGASALAQARPAADAASAPTATASAAANAAANGAANGVTNGAANETVAHLKPWQTTQAALMDQLEPLLRRRIAVLEQTDETLQTLLTQGAELRTLLDQHLLWMPSHQAIGVQWLNEWRMQASEIGALPAMLWAAMRGLLAHAKAQPLAYVLHGALLLALLLLRLQAPQRLQAIAQRMRNMAQDSFVFTLQALGWTLLIALPGAVAAWALGTSLQAVGARQAGQIEGLGQAIAQLSVPWLFVGLLGALIRPDGLGVVHLGWSANLLRALRRARMVAMTVILPAFFIMSLLALHPNTDAAISTQGRLIMMLLAVGLACLSRPMLRRLPQRMLDASPVLMRALGWVLPGMFAGAAALAAAGYVMTGIIVLDALLDSMTVVLFVIVISGLLYRWLLLGERRLALKRLQEEHAATTAVNLEAGEVPPEAEREIELVTVSEQSRRLLRLLRTVLLVLGVIWAWADVLPALLRFDDVVLWRSTTTGAGGTAEAVPISLMDVLLGVVILLLTFSIVRNLPGLLELAFTASRRISSAMRYTITMLARYAITIVGALFAFKLFGLRWSQLQWMAAALTVGLGFGLQEIFANFVSGLILLVERPFRVGDTITIGSLTGSVTRIRTRATTVLDYDNKEIVIPNKTFITGQVTNWTLSDNVTRQTLNVGVAYDSDPAQVRALLLRAASEHPNVLKEPAPNAWFMELGSSTLDFELRVYVATLGL